MTRALVTEESLSNIGNAIRNKLGVETTYKPSEMAGAISSIPSDLGTKAITSNGTYDADDDSLDGYSSVSVNVANSYTAQDEGKVVSSGALVAQTARENEITSNGTYDTTTNDEVTVNVSGGGGGGGGSTNILSGDVMPSASDGNDGDIFILCSELGLIVDDRTGYVLTGLLVNDFDKVEADVKLTEYTSGQYYSLFGVSSSSSSGSSEGKTFRFRDGSSNYGAVGYDGSWYYATSGFFKSGEEYKVEVTIKSGTQKVVANGTTIVNSIGGGETTASKEVALLNNNLNGSPSNSGFKGIIYRCKFYSGETLLRDFVPSVDGEDKVCLYDNVTEEYFYYSKEDKLSLIDGGSISNTYLKVNGSWLPLIGQNIDDVDTGGDGATFSTSVPSSTSGHNDGDFYYQRLGFINAYESFEQSSWTKASSTYSTGQKLRCVSDRDIVGIWVYPTTSTFYLHISSTDGTDLASVTLTNANTQKQFIWLDEPIHVSAGDEIVVWHSNTGAGNYSTAISKTPTDSGFGHVATVYKSGVNKFPNEVIATNVYPVSPVSVDTSSDPVVVRQWIMKSGEWVEITK